MTNMALSREVLKTCALQGVREVVLCAGARNAPLVSLLTQARGVRTYSFFDERAAGFFALGRMQSLGAPVAVITTSGTAVAELLPAVIEADYQGLPLLVISADRPRRYRGSGAPQTIDQPGIFSHYVERDFDIEGTCPTDFAWSNRRPVHVNVCFDEPLLDEVPHPFHWWSAPAREREKHEFECPRVELTEPLVIVGGLPPLQVRAVRERLRDWRRPVYLEAPSQLRGHPELADLEILEADIRDLEFDGVIRVGSVPTLRYWRDLESSDLPVLHFSHLPFSGLPRAPKVYPLDCLAAWPLKAWSKPASIAEKAARLERLLDAYPTSEPALVHWFSRQLPAGARMFLGNSLPIREWDLAASRESRPQIFVNRGVNGIDGLVSTFLGVADAGQSSWALIGDLSALYDLSGPWALRENPLSDVTIGVINNGGGRIFKRIFDNPLFENEHDVRFEDWARMWNLEYLSVERPVELEPALRPRVIEIRPDASATAEFWRAWEGR